jgi:hypothetical protein
LWPQRLHQVCGVLEKCVVPTDSDQHCGYAT